MSNTNETPKSKRPRIKVYTLVYSTASDTRAVLKHFNVQKYVNPVNHNLKKITLSLINQ